ncbi:MAG TPA: flagellar basal body rod protein FlgB [Candidatus Limnocylindria bacterium]|nr:flagellar basal body rod protein FlgB [Candidatus Limnocylindria bacterium]
MAYRVLGGRRRRVPETMVNAIFNQPTYQAAKSMLDVTVLRHEAISSNLANLETPNYRRVDVSPSFQAELQQAVAAGDTDRMASLKPSIGVDLNAVASNRDGNTVQLENELVQLNQNSMEHALETQLITGSLLRLRLAITGHSN